MRSISTRDALYDCLNSKYVWEAEKVVIRISSVPKNIGSTMEVLSRGDVLCTQQFPYMLSTISISLVKR